MATDLFPISTSSLGGVGNGIQDSMILIYSQSLDSTDGTLFGWDNTNPYEDNMLSNFSLHLPDSSGDTTDLVNDDPLTHVRRDSLSFPFSNDQSANSTFYPYQQTAVNPTFVPPSSSLKESFGTTNEMDISNTFQNSELFKPSITKSLFLKF